MLTLLLGPDDFSKKEYAKSLAKQSKAALEIFSDPQSPPMLENLVQQDLFAGPKIFILENLLGNFTDPKTAEKLIASRNQIFIVADKLDKRTAANKELLANKKIEVKDFSLPHGAALDKWIGERVKFYGGTINGQAIDRLAVLLGRDEAKETKFGGKVVEVQELFSLWQADSEIQKLVAFAGEREIIASDVDALVGKTGETDSFDLVNAIAENNKQEALSRLHYFLQSSSTSDEKSATIMLNALLSEQFRNIAMVQAFLEERHSESEILTATGWKSGRLFVIRKFAAKFPKKKVLDFLAKLKALDIELKSGTVPPKVLLDLITVQLLSP